MNSLPPPDAESGPPSDDYLKHVQELVLAARPGPWDVHLDDDGQPGGFGPFSWVEVWDDDQLLPNMEFARQAREVVPRLLAEVHALRKQAASGPVLGWAARLDADDLEGFLDNLVDAVDAHDDLTALEAVEKVCADWRLAAREDYAR